MHNKKTNPSQPHKNSQPISQVKRSTVLNDKWHLKEAEVTEHALPCLSPFLSRLCGWVKTVQMQTGLTQRRTKQAEGRRVAGELGRITPQRVNPPDGILCLTAWFNSPSFGVYVQQLQETTFLCVLEVSLFAERNNTKYQSPHWSGRTRPGIHRLHLFWGGGSPCLKTNTRNCCWQVLIIM